MIQLGLGENRGRCKLRFEGKYVKQSIVDEALEGYVKKKKEEKKKWMNSVNVPKIPPHHRGLWEQNGSYANSMRSLEEKLPKSQV